MLAIAVTSFVLGDSFLSYYEAVLHQDVPFTSIADALYLFPYPFYAVAVVRLARGVRRQRPAEDSLDAPIVTIGALALLWHFLMHSYARDNALSVVERVVTLAYRSWT